MLYKFNAVHYYYFSFSTLPVFNPRVDNYTNCFSFFLVCSSIQHVFFLFGWTLFTTIGIPKLEILIVGFPVVAVHVSKSCSLVSYVIEPFINKLERIWVILWNGWLKDTCLPVMVTITVTMFLWVNTYICISTMSTIRTTKWYDFVKHTVSNWNTRFSFLSTTNIGIPILLYQYVCMIQNSWHRGFVFSHYYFCHVLMKITRNG